MRDYEVFPRHEVIRVAFLTISTCLPDECVASWLERETDRGTVGETSSPTFAAAQEFASARLLAYASKNTPEESNMSGFPYEEQFGVNRVLPENGTDKEVILSMLSTMSQAENPVWEGGQCSGTMYCGDHDHYDFLNLAFSQFSYVNSLQRDMCPSSTKFEAEIIAMTLDLLGAGTLTDTTPVGLVTSGGSL